MKVYSAFQTLMNEQNSDVNRDGANNEPEDSGSSPLNPDVKIQRELNTSESSNEGSKPDDVNKSRSFRRWIREESSLTDWLIALFTIVLAAVSILQWIVLSGQLREMRSGSFDTHALAIAAQKQADAADKFARSAGSINTEIKSAVGQITSAAGNLQRMATSSESSITATQKEMRLDQRAWVGIIEAVTAPKLKEGSRISVAFHLINSGKTPALKVSEFSVWRLISAEEPFDPVRDVSGAKRVGGGVMQPGSQRILTATTDIDLTKEEVQFVLRRLLLFYVFGKITYTDVFRVPHWTTYCMRLQPTDPIGFSPCKTYNDAN